MKRFIVLIIIMILPIMVNAKDITNECKIKVGYYPTKDITDDNFSTFLTKSKNYALSVECEENIKNVYIMYHDHATKGKILFDNYENIVGQNGYLHELIKVNNNVNTFKIQYEDEFSIADIYIYNDDNLPDMVQDWKNLDTADLMLFTTHADDEQLFFAGLMPTYVDAGKKIQVVYFTRHTNNVLRYHELLNGLWAVGIKYYPVVSDFPDAWATTRDGALLNLQNAGFSLEDAIKYEVTQIRKYKPYVVVGHDEKGEYSHGQHMLNTYVLESAYKLAYDKNYTIEGVGYEPWEIQKLYLHLYKENPIVLDYDKPLSSFGGKTAYEVSKIGYSYHLSQQYTWFTDWLNGKNNSFTSATQIKTYSPCEYGLYYSAVGEDEEKNNMFENVKDVKNTKEPIKDDQNQDQNTTVDINNNNSLGSNILLYVAIGIVLVIIIILIISLVR